MDINYLASLGIQSWSLRYPSISEKLCYYPLSDQDKHQGYLLLEDLGPAFNLHSKMMQLIAQILKSVGLKLSGSAVSVSDTYRMDTTGAALIIAMGQQAIEFATDQLPAELKKIHCLDPRQLLTWPQRKKEVWLSLSPLYLMT